MVNYSLPGGRPFQPTTLYTGRALRYSPRGLLPHCKGVRGLPVVATAAMHWHANGHAGLPLQSLAGRRIKEKPEIHYTRKQCIYKTFNSQLIIYRNQCLNLIIWKPCPFP